MTFPNFSSLRSAPGKIASIAMGCALVLSLASASATRAADSATLRSLDDKLANLPLTASFDKADGDNGPYVLSLKNTSGDSIKVSGSVLLSVMSHNNSKTRDIPEHVVGRAEVWTIPGLAAGDKVTLMASGFTPLELTVPVAP
jgi:hypothetical protein